MRVGDEVVLLKCPLVPINTGTFSASESLSELSELELLDVESLRAPSSLSTVTEGFVVGWVFVAGDDLEGAEEFTVGNDPDDGKGQSSLSEPIIGKLAKVDGTTDGCTGELKFN